MVYPMCSGISTTLLPAKKHDGLMQVAGEICCNLVFAMHILYKSLHDILAILG